MLLPIEISNVTIEDGNPDVKMKQMHISDKAVVGFQVLE
jgi:hypothetical protein